MSDQHHFYAEQICIKAVVTIKTQQNNHLDMNFLLQYILTQFKFIAK